jgi:DNA-binding MarR family transcriptional regulator
VTADDYPLDHVSEYPVTEIAAAWQRERPGTPVSSIEIVTPIWRLAKLLADDRRRVLATAGVDGATLDLLGLLRRSGPPYALSTREIAARTMVTAGAVSQRVARAERDDLVTRTPGGGRSVVVTLTAEGHAAVERTVDLVLGREAALLDGLPAGQRARLAELLAVLLDQLSERI